MFWEQLYLWRWWIWCWCLVFVMEWKKVSRVNINTIFFMHLFGITCHNMQHFTRFCFFGISHCMKEVFGKICVKRCLVQICKPPPGINPIKHEVPPGHFVSTLPHCAQYSTLCIISFCCTTIVHGFRGLEMALIMGARCTTWPSTTAGKWPPARTSKGWSTKIYDTSTFSTRMSFVLVTSLLHLVIVANADIEVGWQTILHGTMKI